MIGIVQTERGGLLNLGTRQTRWPKDVASFD